MQYAHDSITGKVYRQEAIQVLVRGSISGYSDGTSTVYHDGQTPPSESAIDAKLAELQTAHDALLYARNRWREYYALNQFELMTDDAANSTTTHADAIAAIKTKWPKNNTGPVE